MQNCSRFDQAKALSEKEVKRGDCETCYSLAVPLIDGMCELCRGKYLIQNEPELSR